LKLLTIPFLTLSAIILFNSCKRDIVLVNDLSEQKMSHKSIKFFLFVLLFFFNSYVFGQGTFFRQYWAEFDPDVSNHKDGRWRVNDAELSLNERFGKRPEARANGLMLINIPEDLFLQKKSELYLEMWGGHPKTANKRLILNGKETYFLPKKGTEDNNCTYTYPTVLRNILSDTKHHGIEILLPGPDLICRFIK
jgi:hypothetical protein